MTTFGPIFVPEAAQAAVSDRSWVAAMLEAERALAAASAGVGIFPKEAAAEIAEACDPEAYDLAAILAAGRAAANPAGPLVAALRERIGGDATRWVHLGATSQDVVDTAAMLVTRTAAGLAADELEGAGTAAALLAEEHRATPMAARTLLQQAVPTTFGAKAAGWLVALAEARDRLRALRLPAQLGGAAGTLAAFGDRGLDVLAAFAAELELDEPPVPWHANRAPVAEIGAALDLAATACGKIGLDVVLLAQTEVGEVAEETGGSSSTMPHKHNPARGVLARSCALLVHANTSLLGSGAHEHERAAGAWQAEWPALAEALAHACGAAAAARECLESLRVDPERMRTNMTRDLYAERDRLEIDDPAYLGVADALVDRALTRWRERR